MPNTTPRKGGRSATTKKHEYRADARNREPERRPAAARPDPDPETDAAASPDDGDQDDRDTRRDRLSPEDREWVRRTVAELGPLTEDERQFLATVFKNRR